MLIEVPLGINEVCKVCMQMESSLHMDTGYMTNEPLEVYSGFLGHGLVIESESGVNSKA